MNDSRRNDLASYYRSASSWSEDRLRELNSSRRLAWIFAGIAAAVALLEGIALIALTPLKTVVPYTLMVDRQTGYVQELKPLSRETIAPDTALVRSFLVQYVIAREGFDIDSFRDNFRKVALWSAGQARARYVSEMQGNNPASPLASLPRRALIEVQLRSVSSIGADTAMVRFATVRTDLGAQAQAPQLWAAVIKYRFSNGAMSAADRMVNPLGFQVIRYRRDAEVLPEAPRAVPTTPMPAASVPAVTPENDAQ